MGPVTHSHWFHWADVGKCSDQTSPFSLWLEFGGVAYLTGEPVIEVCELDLWIMFVHFGAFLMQLKRSFCGSTEDISAPGIN